MTTYYVDPVNGSNSNNGLGPDASHATNKPVATIAKLIGASGLMASGDTAYAAPGTFREAVSATLAPTAETKILADPGNIQGFKTSGGVLVAPGAVIISAYLTNDKTAPSVAAAVLSFNNKNFYTFQYFTVITGGGSSNGISGGSTGAHDIKLLDCTIIPGGALQHSSSALILCLVPFGVAANWTIDRCVIVKGSGNSIGAVRVSLASGSGADWDANIVVQNNLFIGGGGHCVYVVGTGAGANKGGGVKARSNTQLSAGVFMECNTSVLSTSQPCVAYGNYIWNAGSSRPFIATTSGQIVEDYNLVMNDESNFPNSNVTHGAHSIYGGTYAPLFHVGQERQWGANRRLFMSPMDGSPILGFGSDASEPAYDFQNNPRPAGGGTLATPSAAYAAGYSERPNTWKQETGTVRTGANALSITGPGYQDFDVPVDATSTVITVYMRYDSTYAGTRPQFSVLNGEECGVAAASVTATTSALNAWEQQSLTVVPTSKGIITVRVASNDTNGAGKAFADDFAVV